MHKFSRVALLAVFLTMVSNTSAETLTFGVVPQQAASKLARLWTPILNHLSEQSGHTIVFKTAPNIPTFEQRLASGDYDLAYMNPYHFTVFHEAPRYQALARARDKRIRGIVVVRKDSSINSIAELAGTTLAFPAPAAFAASMLPRAEFTAREIAFHPKYVSSHDSVYRTVARGLYPAGGGVVRTFNNLDEATRAQLRILWKTDEYTPHAVASHPRVSENVRQAVLKALIELENSDAGKALLGSIKIKGFQQANNADWDDVRALNLNELSLAAND